MASEMGFLKIYYYDNDDYFSLFTCEFEEQHNETAPLNSLKGLFNKLQSVGSAFKVKNKKSYLWLLCFLSDLASWKIIVQIDHWDIVLETALCIPLYYCRKKPIFF